MWLPRYSDLPNTSSISRLFLSRLFSLSHILKQWSRTCSIYQDIFHCMLSQMRGLVFSNEPDLLKLRAAIAEAFHQKQYMSYNMCRCCLPRSADLRSPLPIHIFPVHHYQGTAQALDAL